MSNIIHRDKTLKGDDFEIRYPVVGDAKDMCDYINALSSERTYVIFQGEQTSLEMEEKYVKSQIEKIAKKQAVTLLAITSGKIIGIADINMKDRVESHIGVFAISIAKEFRQEGIGSILMDTVIKEAIKSIPDLEIIVLEIFANNAVARQMYEKYGFVEYGNLPDGIKVESGYVDRVYMYKNVIGG